jgi:hypothetical protein
MAMMAGGLNIQITFFANMTNLGTTPGIKTVSLTLNSDGSSAKGAGTGSVSAWTSPITTGIGFQVWVALGAASGGGTQSWTNGSFASLTSGASFTLSSASSGTENNGNVTLTFSANSSGTAVLGTGTWSYDCGYAP